MEYKELWDFSPSGTPTCFAPAVPSLYALGAPVGNHCVRVLYWVYVVSFISMCTVAGDWRDAVEQQMMRLSQADEDLPSSRR